MGENPATLRLAVSVLGNPARTPEATRFVVELPVDALATVRVLDVTGRAVATIASARMPAGRRELSWSRPDSRGVRVPAGVYFADLEAGNVGARTKFVVLAGAQR